jgi:hypothetical protein
MRTEILTTLIEARRIVAAGWIQWAWEDERGRCLMGAINHASDDCAVLSAAYDRLKAQLPWADSAEPLMAWNDSDGRTQAEVLDLLDRAIADMMREKAPAPAVERELEPA